MQKFGAIVVVLSMLAPNAFAAGTVAPLAPGKPAGVQKAQEAHTLALWIVGAGIIGGGILLATSGKSNNTIGTTVTTTTTTTTGTHP